MRLPCFCVRLGFSSSMRKDISLCGVKMTLGDKYTLHIEASTTSASTESDGDNVSASIRASLCRQDAGHVLYIYINAISHKTSSPIYTYIYTHVHHHPLAIPTAKGPPSYLLKAPNPRTAPGACRTSYLAAASTLFVPDRRRLRDGDPLISPSSVSLYLPSFAVAA